MCSELNHCISGDLPTEDIDHRFVFGHHAGQAPEPSTVGSPLHPLCGRSLGPGTAHRLLPKQSPRGTKPHAWPHCCACPVLSLRLRGGLFREDPEGNQSNDLAAKRPVRSHRISHRFHYHGTEWWSQSLGEGILLWIWLRCVDCYMPAVLRGTSGGRCGQICRQYSERFRNFWCNYHLVYSSNILFWLSFVHTVFCGGHIGHHFSFHVQQVCPYQTHHHHHCDTEGLMSLPV